MPVITKKLTNTTTSKYYSVSGKYKLIKYKANGKVLRVFNLWPKTRREFFSFVKAIEKGMKHGT